MIAVGMMDRRIDLYIRTQNSDSSYGGINNIRYSKQDENIYSHVVWKGGKVDEKGEQMQNNQVVEFYCRNGGVMANSTVEDYIVMTDRNEKFYIDAINIISGREKYLQIITTRVTVNVIAT